MTGPEFPKAPGEFDLIGAIRASTTTSARVKLGIGDDCASISWPDPVEMLITTDMLMDGRHFRLGEASPEQIGFKCLAVNLSDIAAMAGEPIAAVVAVALPRKEADTILAGLHRGMIGLAQEFEVDLVGGDTNAWDGPLVVSLTLIGRATSKGAVRRSGARTGDFIYVTGPLGGSIRGRHLMPAPRVREALMLHAEFHITAMIDLSDGLASDLGHLLEESGRLGAVLQASSIPIHPDVETLAERQRLVHALTDGEDFELCFTIAPDDHVVLQRGLSEDSAYPFSQLKHSLPRAAAKLRCIGRVVGQGGLFVQHDLEHPPEHWISKGFDHLRS